MGETRRYVVDADTIARGDLMEIIDPIWMGSNFYEGAAEYESSLTPFSRQQRLVWAVLWYDREVCNGGHEQFFCNSTGSVWPEALEGLGVIGLSEAQEILREATARSDVAPSRVRSEREIQLSRCGATFDDLDDRYYALIKGIDLEEHLLAYTRANQEAFLFDGDVTKQD